MNIKFRSDETMADIKSCEGKVTTLECMVCGYREVFTERQFKFTDGLRCNGCNGPVQPSITRLGENVRNRKMKHDENEIVTYAKYKCLSCDHGDFEKGKRKDYKEVLLCPKCNGLYVDSWKIHKYAHLKEKKNSVGKLTVEIDVSEALKGLKAVQREAKKAAQALKEVEELKTKYRGN
jgi:hypothetical protein